MKGNMTAAKIDDKQIARKVEKATVGRMASIFLSLSLIFHGCYNVLQKDTNAALADFAGALGTAGLPRWWARGMTITFNDPEPLTGIDPLTHVEVVKPSSCWGRDRDQP